jgi:ATP-dependent 26S proteasome regulatory subunit
MVRELFEKAKASWTCILFMDVLGIEKGLRIVVGNNPSLLAA